MNYGVIFGILTLKGINLPIYIGMIIVLIATMAIGKIPHTIVGAISVLVILGDFYTI